ncbi:anaphase-promoting complex subunit 3-like, partial [Rhagoletis pomonella]|uniref:anaphase-promoting complex subunit 3-like n=1 Tax=Rhagoletis pomonella TaxID=28610 RepID=UPI001785749B
MSSNKKSDVWLHFSEEKDKKVKCKLCGQQLSVSNKSTCGLIRHMNRRHQFQRISRQAQPVEEVLLDIEGSELNNNISEVNNNISEVNNNTSAVNNHNPHQLNNSTVAPQVPAQIQPRALNASQPQVTNFLYKPLPIKKQREIDQQ